MKLSELAERTGARADEKDSDIEIRGAAGLDEAVAGDVAFLANPRYTPRVQATAAEVRRALDRHNTERHVRVLGPAPAPLARLRGEHRVQVLLKSRSRPRLRELIQLALTDAAATHGCDAGSVNVEIDPVSLM